MSDALKEMIIEELVLQHSRSDIIQAVCERGNMRWPEAEALVQQVEVEKAHVIAGGQSPILIFMSVVICLAGVFLLLSSLQTLTGVMGLDFGVWLGSLAYLTVEINPFAVGFTGLAMIAGGLIGLWKTAVRYFETS